MIVGTAGAKAERLERRIVEEGDSYGALQTCKTLHARACKKREFLEAADLVRASALALLRQADLTGAEELALLLVDTLEKGAIKTSANDAKEVVLAVAGAFDSDTLKDRPQDAAKSQARFLKAAISWSTLTHHGTFEKGDPQLHRLAASAKVKMGDLAGAATHYLHAHEPKEFASFLFQWSSKGYHGERDMFIARAVLQLLALENMKDANILLATFIALGKMQNKPVPETPLLHFTEFLLKTVERDAFPLFRMICEKYQKSIQRDPSFQMYLDRISQIYFGVQPQKRGMQAMMENMLGMFSR